MEACVRRWGLTLKKTWDPHKRNQLSKQKTIWGDGEVFTFQLLLHVCHSSVGKVIFIFSRMLLLFLFPFKLSRWIWKVTIPILIPDLVLARKIVPLLFISFVNCAMLSSRLVGVESPFSFLFLFPFFFLFQPLNEVVVFPPNLSTVACCCSSWPVLEFFQFSSFSIPSSSLCSPPSWPNISQF